MKTILLFLSLFCGFLLSAQTNNNSVVNYLQKGKLFMGSHQIAFEENNGQLQGEDANRVKYTYKNDGLSVFLMNDGIAYQFTKIHYPKGYKTPSKSNTPEERETSELLEKNIRIETYRMDVVLQDANPSSRITTEGKSFDYTQFYNHNTLNVYNYSKIIYHNVYPNIDWVVYSKEGNLKYDFVVHPGGNPKNIKLETKWVEELELNSRGNLVLKNRMGEISEEQPISFQEGKEIETSFILNENQISFDIENYDYTKELIVDPIVRIWGTYYGGGSSDQINDCVTDPSGNVFVAGLTISTSSIASGGHDNSYGGGSYDAFLVKFNSAGVRQWGTYYGGSLSDFAYGCATDASGNSYICGPTYSTSGMASGGYDNTHAGNNDAFLVKFNSAGVRQWATYHGGSSFDNGDGCTTDASGNIYMAGGTESSGLATAGVHKTSGSGNSDAYLSKFNSSGARLWCTYYGGSGDDRYVYGCATDPSGNPYIAGRTQSSSNIASSGAHDVSYGGSGNDDAFLAKFNTSNGQRLWGTYYGTPTFDWANDCTTDASGNVYLVGGTSSTTSIASGGHQNTSGGSTEGYLVKFNSSGTRQWGTYYGGTGSDIFEGCATDASGNIYASGWTSSTSGIASGGFQNTIGGSSDGLLVKFNSAGVRQWGTYYGGTNAERDGNCAIDVSGNVFLAGTTVSTTNIASSGAHDVTYGGGSDDGYIVKFSDCVPETNTTPTTSICENQTKTLASSGAGVGAWSIVSGGGSISGTTYTPANVSSNTNVTVRFTDGCGNTNDRVFTVNVRNVASNITSLGAICENQTKTLVGSPSGGSWSVISGGGTTSGTTYTPANVSSNTNVTIRYTIAANGGCPATTSDSVFTVNVNETAINTTSTASICESSTKTLVGSPAGGSWSIVAGGGSILGTTYTPANVSLNTAVTVRYTIAANGGCLATISDRIFTVNVNEIAINTTSTVAICESSTKALVGSPAGGNWSVIAGGGSILGTTYTSANITANTNVTVRYTISVNGACSATTSDRVFTVEPLYTPSITSSNTDMCSGDKRLLTGTPTGGLFSITSSGSTGVMLTNDTLQAGTTSPIQIRYRLTNSCGNMDATQSINIGSTVSATITSSSASLCSETPLNLTATPSGGIWTILSGPGTESAGVLTPTGAGIISIKYDVVSSCGNGADTVDIVINPLPNASAGLDENICSGDTVLLMATGGGTYQWVSGSALATNQVYPSSTTGYRVDITSDSGCVASDSVTVFVQTSGTATAQNDQAIVTTGIQQTIDIYTNDVGEIATLQILSGPNNGTGSISLGNIIYTSTTGYIGTDTIQYEICDANCQVVCDTAYLYLTVESDLIIPIGISANGDGKNDVFNILGLGRYPNNSLKVFNRWGSLVFQAEPYLNNWEGQSIKGEAVEGTYFYILELGDELPLNKGYIELKK
jgi:gliding motility-associated-like protein